MEWINLDEAVDTAVNHLAAQNTGSYLTGS